MVRDLNFTRLDRSPKQPPSSRRHRIACTPRTHGRTIRRAHCVALPGLTLIRRQLKAHGTLGLHANSAVMPVAIPGQSMFGVGRKRLRHLARPAKLRRRRRFLLGLCPSSRLTSLSFLALNIDSRLKAPDTTAQFAAGGARPDIANAAQCVGLVVLRDDCGNVDHPNVAAEGLQSGGARHGSAPTRFRR
jgi:hypothetical protein